MNFQTAHANYEKLAANIRNVICGKEDLIKKMLAAFFSGGHVLLEDVPGTGKTTLAKSLAKSIGTQFARVQFTPDLLPADILGLSIYEQASGSFHFNKGPIFTNILLADEINRASPRTQSALLEAMAEKQISIEAKEYQLDNLFFVIATENPVESHGTYPLPESQMDRFMVKLCPGYLDRDTEVTMLADQIAGHPLTHLSQVITDTEIFAIMDIVQQTRLSKEIQYYIVDIVAATRKADHILLGAGPRGTLALGKMAQGLAFIHGREFVSPEDIHEAAVPVLSHRIELQPQAKFAGQSDEELVLDLLQTIPVPQ